MRKQMKNKNKKETGKLEVTICCFLFIFITICYMLFVTFFIDPKWDSRMEQEIVPIEQLIDEGNQKDEGGYRYEREKEIEEGEKLKCPDKYGEMIGGDYNE